MLEYLDQDNMQKYQSLAGPIQWEESLGIIDINTSVMTLASFRSEPRQERLDRDKRLVFLSCQVQKLYSKDQDRRTMLVFNYHHSLLLGRGSQ